MIAPCKALAARARRALHEYRRSRSGHADLVECRRVVERRQIARRATAVNTANDAPHHLGAARLWQLSDEVNDARTEWPAKPHVHVLRDRALEPIDTLAKLKPLLKDGTVTAG